MSAHFAQSQLHVFAPTSIADERLKTERALIFFRRKDGRERERERNIYVERERKRKREQ